MKQRRREWQPHYAALCSMGACKDIDDPEYIAELKRATHDLVIQGAGNARRSGVTWLVLPAEKGIEFLSDPAERPMREIEPPGVEGYHLQLIGYLRLCPGGALVIASVMCDTRAAMASRN